MLHGDKTVPKPSDEHSSEDISRMKDELIGIQRQQVALLERRIRFYQQVETQNRRMRALMTETSAYLTSEPNKVTQERLVQKLNAELYNLPEPPEN